jgi:hypothetical protein
MKKHIRGIKRPYHREYYHVKYLMGDTKKKYSKIMGSIYFDAIFKDMLYEEQVGWYQFLYNISFKTAERFLQNYTPKKEIIINKLPRPKYNKKDHFKYF